MPRVLLDIDSRPSSLAAARRRRIAETLGSAPRESLAAMAGYGLSDDEIGRYYGLPPRAVTKLRTRWGIDGQR